MPHRQSFSLALFSLMPPHPNTILCVTIILKFEFAFGSVLIFVFEHLETFRALSHYFLANQLEANQYKGHIIT